MLRPLAYSLVLAGALASTCVDAQESSPAPPQPTRWAHSATTIPTGKIVPPSNASSLPATNASHLSASNGSSPPASNTGDLATSNAANFPTLRASASQPSAEKGDADASDTLAQPVITVTSSLAVVLGLFAALVWISRKFGSHTVKGGAIPREVLQSLGTTPIDAKTRVTMLRCGNRILIVAQTATGIHPLSEVTDPEEVQHLTATCLGDANHDFKSTLQSIQREPVESGFVEQQPAKPQKRSKLFATA